LTWGFGQLSKSWLTDQLRRSSTVKGVMITVSSAHPISASAVKQKLAGEVDFRARLNFEMEDADVHVDNSQRNLNFLATINPFPGQFRIFQNDIVTWPGQDTMITVRYLFRRSGQAIRIESRRRISQTSETTSSSVVTIAITENQLTDDYGRAAMAYVERRILCENRLLGLFQASNRPIAQPSDLPLDVSFAGVQDSLGQLDRILEERARVDPALPAAIGEIERFQAAIGRSAEELMAAMRERNQLHREVRNQIERMAAIAGEIELGRLDEGREGDGNNGLALAFSIIPIVAGLVWIFFTRRRGGD
jgi:hypothetical protein